MTFTLSEKEIAALKDLISKKHNLGAIEYRFSNRSGIGMTVKIYSKNLDKEFDITDYGSW